MQLSKSTKYWFATGGLAVLAVVTIRFVGEATHQPTDGSRRTYYLVLGVILFVLLAIVAVARAYYRRDRNSIVDESSLGSELAAEGLIAVDRHSPITLTMTVTGAELRTLADTGILTVSTDRFSVPVRKDDAVRLQQGDDNYRQHIYGVVSSIDGVNRQILIKRSDRLPTSHRVDS